jgi:hypothetical protein
LRKLQEALVLLKSQAKDLQLLILGVTKRRRRRTFSLKCKKRGTKRSSKRNRR